MSTNPTTQSLEAYRQRLRSDFPNLDVTDLTLLGGGMDHVALEVDGLVFRLPTNKSRNLNAGTEIAILKQLSGRLPIQIPTPTHIASGNDYFGYIKLPGTIAYEHPKVVETDEYILQWVEITQAIHASISPDEAHALGLPQFNALTHFGYYERVVTLQSDATMTPAVRSFAERTLDRIHSINLEGRERLFLHNDFHAKNVLLDPDTMRITGLIDWSDMIVGPIECEFWIWEWSSPASLERVAQLYTERTGRLVNLDEARAWLHLAELADYYDALRANDQQEATEVLEHIQRWISEGK